MPKSGTRALSKDNEIVRRLKAGNGKIAGLKMLAAVDDAALMPVDVIGIDYAVGKSSYTNGISIHVKPTGGHGSIWIAPGELIDNTPPAIDLFQRKAKAQEAFRAFQSARSDRERRAFILQMRDKMDAAGKQLLAERLPDRLGKSAEEDPVKAINKASGEYELREVAMLAAKIVYNVVDTEEYD